MFDIGFPELLVVSIVALLVIGPDKLPETIRTVAMWLGRIRRSVANIKTELEQELGADEIRQALHNEAIMKELNDAKGEINGIINETTTSLNEIKNASRTNPRDLLADTTADDASPALAPPANVTNEDAPEKDDGKRQSETGR